MISLSPKKGSMPRERGFWEKRKSFTICYRLTVDFFGKLLLIGDIVIVAFVLSYLASVKAKSL